MSGHSKWHTIKHKKGALDAKRGKLFTRLIKEMTVAARNGGGDINSNPRLRTVVTEAKAANMPAENIKRAIQRGPGGAAIIIETMTDNKNRTVGEIRHMLAKFNGNLGAENSVAWMFSKKGYMVIEKAGVDEEKLMEAVLEAGADDFRDDGDSYEVISDTATFEAVKDAVKALNIEPVTAKVSMLPQNYVKLEGKDASRMLKLMEAVEDHDDVQNVWSNFDIDEKEIEASLA